MIDDEKFSNFSKFALLLIVLAFIVGTFVFLASEVDLLAEGEDSSQADAGEDVVLPEISPEETELESLIYERTSVRDFRDEEISKEKAARLLWSTVGITVDGISGPTRAAPSAGATDPLVVYLSVGQVEDLSSGIYRYNPEENKLTKVVSGDRSAELAQAGLGQGAIGEAPLSLIITADFARTTDRYGERGERYVKIEAGHAAQNANLVAESLGLGGVMIGAFNDQEVQQVLGDISEEPLMIIPLGEKE